MVDEKLREEVFRLHAQMCGGLADASRILILYTLAERPYHVTELANALGLLQPTVSRHLKVLRERGMVEAERDGQAVYYSLADRRIIEALDLLRDVMADSLESQIRLARSVSENGKSNGKSH
jgi:ArsR family transcriptional regulator